MSPAEQLRNLPETKQKEFINSLTEEQCNQLMHDWKGFLARPNQITPTGKWDIWLILAGRGFGKTRTGAEWIREQIDKHDVRKIAIVGETAADARDVMVEGEAGILNVYPNNQQPKYEPSKRQITWGNGAVAKIYNATEPDQLRGPQHEIAWCDEIAKWKYAQETWDQLQFGLRIGKQPRQIITTTPRPIKLLKEIIAGNEGKVHVTRGKTIDNVSNLAPNFIQKIQKRYEGTRLGKQELNGEILEDIPGALWRLNDIDVHRYDNIPNDIQRIIVAVDPAISDGEDANYNGIVVAGINEDQNGFVIEDASMKGSPLEWARRAIAIHDKYDADGIVAEVNQGGLMVTETLRTVRRDINIIEVRATRGKHVRAEPVAALYEQGRIHHIGQMTELETQMTMMTNSGYQGNDSPDRVDALVWAMTELMPDITQINPTNIPEFRIKPVI